MGGAVSLIPRRNTPCLGTISYLNIKIYLRRTIVRIVLFRQLCILEGTVHEGVGST